MAEVEEWVQENEVVVVELEGHAGDGEETFVRMDVKRKLEKRMFELTELKNIANDYSQKLTYLQQQVIADVERIQRNELEGQFTKEELQGIERDLLEVAASAEEIAEKNEEVLVQRDEVE